MRDELRPRVEGRDLTAIEALAAEDRRTLSRILPFTYQPDGLLRWRAVEAMGAAAGAVADRDPEFVRGIIRRLFWSISGESGSVGWSAPEAIGEIVARRPDLFPEYAPLVVSLFENLEEPYFRPGILWAIGRIAAAAPALVPDAYRQVARLLGDSDPQVAGLAAWCMGRLGNPDAAEAVASLLTDRRTVLLYEGGALVTTTVGVLATAASSGLSAAPCNQAQ